MEYEIIFLLRNTFALFFRLDVMMFLWQPYFDWRNFSNFEEAQKQGNFRVFGYRVGPGPSPWSTTVNPSDISPPSPLACIEMRKLKTYFDQHCYVACFETLFWFGYKSPLPSHVDISLPVYRPC